MSTAPLVSIFIPVYNAHSFVQQAIESVLAQTYSNYELLIINDASTDCTGEIIERYAKHPQVNIYHNTTNLGAPSNWNRGIGLCQGDFIVRLDADDFYAPCYLEKIITFYEQFTNLDLVFTGVNLTYAKQIKQELFYKKSWVRAGTQFLPEILRSCVIRAPSVCVKRSCYESVGNVIPHLKVHHDWEMWVRIAAHNYNVGYIAEPLTYYRILNLNGVTNQAIVNAQSPVDCRYWLQNLELGQLRYRLSDDELTILKQGMYELVMTFAVFAMEGALTQSVQKHLAFAETLLPIQSRGSMQSRLYSRAAEIYFMEGEHHFKAWHFLLQAFKSGFPYRNNYKNLKLLARAFLGKRIFEFVRDRTVARRKFPNLRTG